LPLHKDRLPGMASLYKRQPLPHPYNVFVDPEDAEEDYDERVPELLQIRRVAFRAPAEAAKGAQGERKPLVVIVASGGGLRSAAWTFAMLERLEREFRKDMSSAVNFPAHVRLVSGASGGMLGAAAYIAALPNPALMEQGW